MLEFKIPPVTFIRSLTESMLNLQSGNMVMPRERVLQPALAMASAFVVFIAAARGASAHCHETSAAKCYIDTMSPRVLSGYEVDGGPDTPMTREFCAQVSRDSRGCGHGT
jgi:hypothetical protein